MNALDRKRERYLMEATTSTPSSWDERIVRFLEAGEPLIEHYGFKKTSVEEICRAAGASTKTFYQFFQDKSHYFIMLSVRVSQRIIDTWTAEAFEFKNHSEKLTAYLKTYVRERREHSILQIGYQEMDSFSNLNVIRSFVPRLPLWNQLTELIREGQDADEFKSGDPISYALTAYSTLNTTLFFMPGRYGSTVYEADTEFENLVIDFVVRGIGGCND